LDGDHYKSTTFSTFKIAFVAITTIEIRRFTCYWTIDEGSGTIAFF